MKFPQNYLPVNDSGDIEPNAQLLNVALKVHKVVTVLGDRLDDAYSEIGDDRDLPSTSIALVYEALAEELITGGAADIDTLKEYVVAELFMLHWTSLF